MNKPSSYASVFGTRMLAIVLLIFSVTLAVAAQQQNVHAVGDETLPSTKASAPATSSTNSEKPAVENERLTFKDRFSAYRQSTFTPPALIFPAIAASFNQLMNEPSEW